jgi:hypothetical protein
MSSTNDPPDHHDQHDPSDAGPDRATVRVTVTASEQKYFAALFQYAENLRAHWHVDPDAGESVALALAYVTGCQPEDLLGEIVENPVSVIPDAAFLKLPLESRRALRVVRLRPRPAQIDAEDVSDMLRPAGEAPTETAENLLARAQRDARTKPTLRVTMARSEVTIVKALAGFAQSLSTDWRDAPKDATEARVMSGEAQARALAWLCCVPVETFAGEIVEQPFTLVSDRKWWSGMTDAQRQARRVQKIGPLEKMLRDPARAGADAEGRK